MLKPEVEQVSFIKNVFFITALAGKSQWQQTRQVVTLHRIQETFIFACTSNLAKQFPKNKWKNIY